ncbi:MAG: metallophosphoesterase family protein [Nanoarchaeota archaeon]
MNEELNKLLKIPRDMKIIFNYTFKYKNYKELNKLKTNSKVLFTHHPPYLKEKETIFGWKPDRAYIIKNKFSIVPALPDEEKARAIDSGDKNIRKFIENNKFKVVFCGHIHEGAGIAKIKDTLIINPGSIAAFQNKKKVLPFSFVELKNDKAYIYFNSWTGEFEKEFKKN